MPPREDHRHLSIRRQLRRPAVLRAVMHGQYVRPHFHMKNFALNHLIVLAGYYRPGATYFHSTTRERQPEARTYFSQATYSILLCVHGAGSASSDL